MSEFEKRREAERKRVEEEKRRARRDRMLLEKASRDKKGVEEKKAAEEIEELHSKVRKPMYFKSLELHFNFKSINESPHTAQVNHQSRISVNQGAR